VPWIIGGGAIYIVLLVTTGTLTFRNGHMLLFWLGIIFPILWLAGSVMQPPQRAHSR
jgi:hypothetical protein